MDHTMFKKAVKWFVVLIGAHLIARLVFGFLFASDLAMNEEWEPQKAYRSLFNLCIIMQLVFAIIYAKVRAYFVDNKTLLKAEMKNPDFSLFGFYKERYLKELIVKLVMFAVFQLPFTIFFAVWGLSIGAPTIIETFYIINAGAYALTGSAILGFIINTVIFSVIFIAVEWLFLLIDKRNAKQMY
ncbi:MAG: hypothetical protein IJ428_02150 [Clostridia bacterium]|nr:hypothetical protein [Clostridia bacterium]